jgi:hypothetical protein
MSRSIETPARATDTTDLGFFAIATRPAIVRRALRYAVIVGTILITINHGDAILRGDVSTGRLLRMVLTCMVPYCVSTASSVEATRAFARERARG